MQVVTGVWICLAGAFAALAGLAGLRRMRQLKRSGATAWATVVPLRGDPPDHVDGTARRVLVQFSLPDGRIVEQACPQRRKAVALRPGQKILVWYDQADASDVLIYRHWGRRADLSFIAAGCGLVIVGIAVAAFGS